MCNRKVATCGGINGNAWCSPFAISYGVGGSFDPSSPTPCTILALSDDGPDRPAITVEFWRTLGLMTENLRAGVDWIDFEYESAWPHKILIQNMRWGHTCRIGSVDRLFPLLAPYLRDLERPRFNRRAGDRSSFCSTPRCSRR